MTYRLKAEESVSKEIKRIASEQIEKAIDELSDSNELGVDEAVHQTRKRLKKTRAVIRLVRDRLGEKSYQQENALYRNLGRKLSDLRDAKVQIKTFDNLIDHFSDAIAPKTFTELRQELQINYRREYQRVLDEGVVTSVKNKLKDAKAEVEDWKIHLNSWSAVDKSLKRVYKRGYKDVDKVLSKPTVENLHEWRKRVKYLRYHLCILRPLWSEIMEEWVDRTHDLSDYLGEDRDLAVLKEFILSQPERFDRNDNLETFTALCDRRRAELQSAAILLGRRIYTEKPKHFISRLENYWQVWRSSV